MGRLEQQQVIRVIVYLNRLNGLILEFSARLDCRSRLADREVLPVSES